MPRLAAKLWNDDAGFVVSAELVLISTITVLALVVGLSEVAHAINQELEDVASAFGAVNQSYAYKGTSGHKGSVAGSGFGDRVDFCDSDLDVVCDGPITGEAY
uniref:Branched-chain amino acid aminotransferase n=1 Tax=Schlesneria paludicola TaxID=360056 RepID=A0A7C2NXN1_9PLAN